MAMDEGLDMAVAYPPRVLRDYALLADGQRGALAAR